MKISAVIPVSGLEHVRYIWLAYYNNGWGGLWLSCAAPGREFFHLLCAQEGLIVLLRAVYLLFFKI
jgi:hypothetical protein